MFILKFLRFLQGYVRFEARGPFVERFLNLVARDRIPVWDSRKRDGLYTGCVRAGSYARLRRHARKTGVRLRIVGKEGAPFQRRRYRRRTGLLMGLLVFCAFLWVMSGFIWRIEVNGNEALSDSDIVDALERIGVTPGRRRASIDVREAETRAILAIDELAWIALNIRGSTLYVEISERIQPPQMVDPNRPCNIVATHSGQILSMRVYSGQSLVAEGDSVLEGDILVSGITQDRLGQSLYRHSLANVTARTGVTLNARVPLAQTQYVETGETITRRYLQVFSVDLPFFLPRSSDNPYRVERTSSGLTFFGFSLPLSLLREDRILMEEVPLTLTEEQAKTQALEELAILEKARLEGAEILSRELSARLEEDVFLLEAVYDCIMEIGSEREIFQDNGSSSDS